MSYDIEKALAYQIKKEIAQRYFRIRKLIEDDSTNAKALLTQLEKIYSDKIKQAFFRIYTLLIDKELIEEFVKLLDLEAPPFWEEFSALDESQKEQLLDGLEHHGWFKEKRYLNLLFDTYKELFKEWKEYYDLREETLDELRLVKEEVDQFTRNYSLDDIMQFLRGLDVGDEATSKALGRTMEGRRLGEFDQKLSVVEDLEGLFERVPKLGKIPDPESIEPALKKIGKEAFLRHQKELEKFL